ncbi:MAG: zf-HC2 domain-containing protein [Gemmatimonadota bacterium]|nr:zf-HC2 domain-containing protein [Gemmatimonadota bacterium]
MNTMMKKMNMMRCDQAMARLWEFLDGELPEEEHRALERHLEVCSRCFPAYDFQRAYLEYTRHLAAQEQAPPELRKEVFLKILDLESSDQQEGGGS